MPEPYILKASHNPGDTDYMTCVDLHVSYDWNYRERNRRDVPGIGTIRSMEHTTRRKSHVRLLARDALSASGGKVSTSWNVLTIKLLDLKKHLKRLRPDDTDTLSILDERIATLQSQIKEIRAERAEVVRAAWRRGTTVQGIEIVDAAEEALSS